MSERLHSKVVSSETWNGKLKTVTLEEMDVISSQDKLNLQAERREGQMKPDQAIKNKEMSVKFMTYTLAIKNS